MQTGTANFVTRKAAISYYAKQGVKKIEVFDKLACGEIHIGKPKLKKDEKLIVIDNGCRYAIES